MSNDSSTTLMLHLNGSDGSTTFTDNNAGGTQKTFTGNGNAQLDTAQKKFGTASLLLDGTGDSITTGDHADFDFGSGDFTIDFWFNVNGGNGTFRGLVWYDNASESAPAFRIWMTSGNVINAYAYSTTGNSGVAGTTTFTSSGWHHVAFVRTSGVLKLFINGVQEGGDVGFADSLRASTQTFWIGQFGADRFYWNGWIDEVRISKGVARWTSNFTPETSEYPDPITGTATITEADDTFTNSYVDNDQYTTVLLHMNGSDGSTTITDDNLGGSSHTWTPSGDAQIDTAQSKFGGASLFLDGTGDYISMPDHADLTMGSGDWTVDLWFKINGGAGTNRAIISNLDSGFVSASIHIYLNASNKIVAQVHVNGSYSTCTSTSTYTDSNWHHLAWVRDGTTLRLFVDGGQQASLGSTTGSVIDQGNALYIGKYGEATSLNWNGWIDEVRISKGIARWTAAFTPPTAAYGALAPMGTATVGGTVNITEAGDTVDAIAYDNDSYTKVLLHMDGSDGSTTFTDSNLGGAAKTWTRTGDAQIDTAQSKFGGAAAYFDGTGDTIETPDSTDFTFGTGDFTIDFWIRRSYSDMTRGVMGWCSPGFVFSTMLTVWSSGTVQWTIQVGATSTGIFAGSVPLDTWTHLALVRNGNTITSYVGGTSVGSITDSGAIPDSSRPLVIGRAGEQGNYFQGWIDEFRVSKGIARWTANFTPPTSAYTDPSTHGDVTVGGTATITEDGDTSSAAGTIPVNATASITEADDTVAPNTDGNDAYTTVLMHMDGSDGSTTITDSNAGGSAHTWTAAGAAQIDTAQSKFGGASAYFDGVAGTKISTPDHADWTFGSGDFTIDFWFRRDGNHGNFNTLMTNADSGGSNYTFAIYLWSDNKIKTRVRVNGTIYDWDSTSTFTDTNWHHYSLVRTGNTLKTFINGTQEGSDQTVSGDANDSTQALRIGLYGNDVNYGYKGWLDEFRISKGIARWTSNFTPPTVAYSGSTYHGEVDVVGTFSITEADDTVAHQQLNSDSYTTVLMHMDGSDGSTTFTDSNAGGSSHTWTRPFGSASIDTDQSKFGGASLYTAGGSDHIATSDHADWTMGSGDFTIDLWCKRNAGSDAWRGLIGNADMSISTYGFFIRTMGDGTNRIQAFATIGGSAVSITSTTAITSSTTDWIHIAFVRTGDTLKLFVNGTQEGSDQSCSGSMTDASNDLNIGQIGPGTSRWLGWIDEVRVSKGIARWTSNFTPPTEAYSGPTLPDGEVDVVGTASLTEASDTHTADGIAAINGTVSITEASDTHTAEGIAAFNGDADITEAGDTISAAGGYTPLTGATTITEADNTISAAGGYTPLTGSVTITEADDGISIAGGHTPLTGAATLTEASDTHSAAGGYSPLTGTVTITESGDTISCAGGAEDEEGTSHTFDDRVRTKVTVTQMTMGDLDIRNLRVTLRNARTTVSTD